MMNKIGDLNDLPARAKDFKKKNKGKLERLRRQKDLSYLCQNAHDQAFANISCLDCANCCKTTGPLFTDRDITRLSRHLNLSYRDFVELYLRMDEDGDMVLQKVPCPFLASDNKCQVYNHRPKACREYPHTDHVNQNKIFPLTLKNSEICPAVLQILQKLVGDIEV